MTPAVASARVVERARERRVQGIASSLADITLDGGEGLRQKIGGAILPTPTLRRAMGSSTIEITIHDPNLRWLSKSLAREKWDAQIDGLWFRYLGTSKQGKSLTLRFEDRNVARLREWRGPVKQLAHRGKPNEVTRAEFNCGLVEEALPYVEIVCPELRERQPIEDARQGQAAQEDADFTRRPGIGDVRGLTVKGIKATAAQKSAGDRALRVAEEEGADSRTMVALMIALIVESLIGDYSSNWLELIPSTAAGSGITPTDLEASCRGFLRGYLPGEEGAVEFARKNPDAKPYEIAQAVQKSGAGLPTNGRGNYGPWTEEGAEWVQAYGGGGGAAPSGKTVVEPFYFEVAGDEGYWEAIQESAGEVNWRAFFVGNRFFYISEPELVRSKVRLAIKRDQGDWLPRGIEDVDFDYNENKRTNTATIAAFVKHWGVPPGAVVTLADLGPASIGFGDAPIKANKKGQRIGISSNRKAKTGEGTGRYLVTEIEIPLEGSEETRKAEIKLRRPTPPRPEPANQTRTVGVPGGELPEGGSVGGMGVLEGTPEDIVNQVVDWAHSNGFPSVTRESVRAANATHGPTISGGTSDHQGPPNVRWAADISNGSSPTAEMTALAWAIAKAFDAPWDGAGLITWEKGNYRFQLIYKTSEGGNHYNHVHFGCSVA
jgi:hypothetical protein